MVIENKHRKPQVTVRLKTRHVSVMAPTVDSISQAVSQTALSIDPSGEVPYINNPFGN